MDKPCKKRVVMAKKVAARWLETVATPEYRLTIFEAGHSKPVRMMASLLRGFRDGKAYLTGVEPITDLGIDEGELAGSIKVWSSNHAALLALDKWLTKRGYETSGIW